MSYPYWQPPRSIYGWACGDVAPAPIDGVRFDTELAGAYQLSQLGIRSDSEVAVSRLRGEAYGAAVGDYVSTFQQILTPTTSFVVEVTTRDIGAGQASVSLVDIEAIAEAEERADIRAERQRLRQAIYTESPGSVGVQAPEEEAYFEAGPASETEVETQQFVQPQETSFEEELQPLEEEVVINDGSSGVVGGEVGQDWDFSEFLGGLFGSGGI